VGMMAASRSPGASGLCGSIRWGVLLAVLLTRARLDAGSAAPLLLGASTQHALPRRGTIVAAQQDPKHALDAWMAAPRGGWRLAVKARPVGTKGFPPGETLGDGADACLARPVSQEQQGR
jgi:hypothetical protein